MKKVIAVLLMLTLAFSLSACGKGTEETDVPEGSSDLKVAMVCSGNLGDSGIFDMGNEGLTQAMEDFGIEYKVLEGKQDVSLYYDLLKTASENYDVVFVNPGYQFDSYLEELATDNPDTFFVYADGTSPLDLDNVISVSYLENEGSYLAGVLAAKMTTNTEIEGINAEKKVGFVGAIDNTTINNFRIGFEQGVKSVDSSIEVTSLFVGDYSDPATGKELANTLYEQGCDVIYAAASTSGDGVSELVAEKGIYAIGVDTDKSPQAPKNILASILKNVGTSFYDVVDVYLKDGDLEKVQRKGLEEKWVDIVYSDYMLNLIPQDIQTAVTDAGQRIIDGTITVDEAK